MDDPTISFRLYIAAFYRQLTDSILAVGGNQIGVVCSKDLCRAFFDMYIGDIPVSEQTKEEIGKNVASIIGKY
ncbi:hypothetical protein NC652_039404 [Populus alba x Populus x berolinensis]|nr:hypothetical protein NC652_039404 [Populus alba x Populus x berolinensis]